MIIILGKPRAPGAPAAPTKTLDKIMKVCMYNRVGRFSLFLENHMLHFRFRCGWPLQATFSFIDFWFDEFCPGGFAIKVLRP